jgi:hypothetical protein
VTPEEDMQEGSPATARQVNAPQPEVNEDDLSVFKDFLENLDTGDEDADSTGDDEGKKKPS